MQPLPESFEKSGWSFNQIARDGNIALFRKDRIGGNAESFEVIVVQSHNGREFKDPESQKVTHYPPAEFYPSSEQWGSKGFSLTTLTDARVRFDEMRAGAKNVLTLKSE